MAVSWKRGRPPRLHRGAGSPAQPRLTDLIGQERVKAALRGHILAAREGQRALDHILMVGPRGMGQVTLAQAVANEWGTPLDRLPEAARDDPTALISYFMTLRFDALLLIEDVDTLANGCLDLVRDHASPQGARVLAPARGFPRSRKVELPPFTIIATAEKVPPALAKSTFSIFLLEPYFTAELREIALRTARRLGIKLDQKAAHLIALNARGAPELAVHLFKRTCDQLQPDAGGKIRYEAAQQALAALGYG